MLLSAVLLAAAVQAAPSGASQAIKVREACRAAGLQLTDQPPPTATPKVRKLGDLPPANHTLTVLRSIDGCPVSSTVRYNVDLPARR
jgi:hypothetical protein